MLERELHLRERESTSATTSPTLTAGHVGASRRRRSNRLVTDHGRVRHDCARRRPRPAAPESAVGGVDQQRADVALGVCRISGAPQTTTSKTFCSLEQVADGEAGQQGGRRAAHVARLDAVTLRARSRSASTSIVGSSAVELHLGLVDTVDAGDDALHLFGLVSRGSRVLAVDPHDDLVARGSAGPR